MNVITGLLSLPMQATTALTKHRLVQQGGAQTVAAITASTQRALGVVNVDVSAAEFAAGKTVDVKVHGSVLAEAGAAITLGARVMPDTSGRVITAATATNIPCGVALKAAAGVGELIPVLLTPGMPAL